MLSYKNKLDESEKVHYGPSPGPCCVGACTYSRSTLELERDKMAIVGGM